MVWDFGAFAKEHGGKELTTIGQTGRLKTGGVCSGIVSGYLKANLRDAINESKSRALYKRFRQMIATRFEEFATDQHLITIAHKNCCTQEKAVQLANAAVSEVEKTISATLAAGTRNDRLTIELQLARRTAEAEKTEFDRLYNHYLWRLTGQVLTPSVIDKNHSYATLVASPLNYLWRAGYYCVALDGKTSGHALAIHIAPRIARFLDPNTSEFEFSSKEALAEFVGPYLQRTYATKQYETFTVIHIADPEVFIGEIMEALDLPQHEIEIARLVFKYL